MKEKRFRGEEVRKEFLKLRIVFKKGSIGFEIKGGGTCSITIIRLYPAFLSRHIANSLLLGGKTYFLLPSSGLCTLF